MFGLTRKVDYALVALAHLANADGHGNEPVSARKIAETYDLPTHLLLNIMKELHQAQIVDSTRGARGGYALKRSPDTIRMTDVIEAIEGPIAIALCCDETDKDPAATDCSCSTIGKCPIIEPIRRLNDRIRDFLYRVTLNDLLTSSVDLPLSALRKV